MEEFGLSCTSKSVWGTPVYKTKGHTHVDVSLS